MSTIAYIDITIVICFTYLLLAYRNIRYRLLLPCTIHAFTWMMVAILIHFTIEGTIGNYERGNDYAHSYELVAPFILGIVIASICGFTLAHILSRETNTDDQLSEEQTIGNIEIILRRYHWILYICCILGVIQAYSIIYLVGFDNLMDYRMAAVTLKRTGYGAIAQQLSGHATILGTFYIALLGYKHAYTGINFKRFFLDIFLLGSTNIAIAGRGWILTALLPYFITYIWQYNTQKKRILGREIRNLATIFAILIVSFSFIGMIRNDSSGIQKEKFVDKFLYYTDGSRITNLTLARMPEESFQLEYGKCEFLSKWIPSPNSEKLKGIKSEDYGLAVTVTSCMPYLYFDFGFYGSFFMWGIICFWLEFFAIRFKKRKSIFGILIFMELTKILFQAPIGPIFNMEIPVIEWMIIIYIFRNLLFSIRE